MVIVFVKSGMALRASNTSHHMWHSSFRGYFLKKIYNTRITKNVKKNGVFKFEVDYVVLPF